MKITNVYETLTKEERIAIKLDCLAKESVADNRNKNINLTGRAVEYESVNADSEIYNAMLIECITDGSTKWVDVSGEVVINQLKELLNDDEIDKDMLASINIRFMTKESKKHNGQSYNILTIGR